MARALGPILFTALAGAACNPSLQLQVLEPSIVTSPPDIHTLAVVDRSRAKNVGQSILGSLEALVTGEDIGADNMGRAQAMTAVVTGLRNSPRFQAVEPFVPRKELESSLFDTEMSWSTARRICKEAGCQGIVSLEAFDSDSSIDVQRKQEKTTDDNGNEVVRTVFEAQRQTRVVTGWRYYDVLEKQIIDDVRSWDRAYTWTERGPSRDRALELLPRQGDAVAYVGGLAGADYARRIAPTYRWVTRSYYGRGDDTLKLAKNHVKAVDWAGAAQLWEGLHSDSPDPKIRGKAAFNLALSAEVEGDLRNAASWATEAAVLLANGKSRNYRALLERRLREQERLEAQMQKTHTPGQLRDEAAPPPPSRAKPPSPRRVEEEREGTTPSGGNRSSTGD
jgi:hypothetical protein